jgi:Cu+-exporting ATPase
MVGTGIGAKNGILIKGGGSLEMAHKVKSVILDKTGTITKGKPEVTNVVALGNFFEKKILEIAASLEKNSEHPLADSIVKKAKEENLRLEAVKDFTAIPGHGIKGRIANKTYYFGNEKLMNDIDVAINDLPVESFEKEGKTAMILSLDKKAIGIVAVADTLKENSIRAVKSMQKMNLKVYMITGDNKITANAIAQQAGIKHVFANVLPEDKAKHVQELKRYGPVAMVGDGINDSPALAKANIGIAMGSGTDVAMETGDVVLMKDDLLDVSKAIYLSKLTMAKIRQNMFWALIYNTIGIPIAALGMLNPMLAGAAMALSSVSVVSNSLLLKRKKL